MIKALPKAGFQIINDLYRAEEINAILTFLDDHQVAQQFGIRSFLQSYPGLIPLLFNQQLKQFIQKIAPKAQVIKSIYFDKPPSTNWIVNWHQDLTINVDRRIEVQGFRHWRELPDRTVVQPPLSLLEKIFTIRIHLDDCTIENGALRVLKASHQNGVIDMHKGVDHLPFEEEICEVSKGGILLMSPLLLHSSKRTENQKRRRVIHLEFCTQHLPKGLQWKEQIAGKLN